MGRRDDTYLKQLQARYRKASKKEKTQMLNVFAIVTGCHRKHAACLLRRGLGQGRQ